MSSPTIFFGRALRCDRAQNKQQDGIFNNHFTDFCSRTVLSGSGVEKHPFLAVFDPFVGHFRRFPIFFRPYPVAKMPLFLHISPKRFHRFWFVPFRPPILDMTIFPLSHFCRISRPKCPFNHARSQVGSLCPLTQCQPQPQPHSHTAAMDATKRTAGMAALYDDDDDDGKVVNLTTTSCSPLPPCATPGLPRHGWRRRGPGGQQEKTPPMMTTPTTTDSLAVRRLAKEVAELQGVRPQDRGVIFRAIAKMGEELGQFCQGEQGICSRGHWQPWSQRASAMMRKRGTTVPHKKSRRSARRRRGGASVRRGQ